MDKRGIYFCANPKWVPLFFWVLWLLAGCAGTYRLTDHPLPPNVRSQVHLIDVPFHAQAALQCGPASLAMVLQWSGVAVLPADLTPEIYTPARQGSLQAGLITGARRHGRIAYPIHGLDCLLEALSDGQPVVVLQNLGLSWLPRWHYAVVVGYDLPREQLILHTGKIAHRTMGLSTFLRTWKRADQWGLLVLNADRMPVCAVEPSYLQAALGLQQAGCLAEAATAFASAVKRWPDSAAAWMALGNALYANADPDAALCAFDRAARLEPANGDPLNNKAHILAEQGALQDAMSAAQRAAQLGGPHLATYLQTLEEIRKRINLKSRPKTEGGRTSGK